MGSTYGKNAELDAILQATGRPFGLTHPDDIAENFANKLSYDRVLSSRDGSITNLFSSSGNANLHESIGNLLFGIITVKNLKDTQSIFDTIRLMGPTEVIEHFFSVIHKSYPSITQNDFIRRFIDLMSDSWFDNLNQISNILRESGNSDAFTDVIADLVSKGKEELVSLMIVRRALATLRVDKLSDSGLPSISSITDFFKISTLDDIPDVDISNVWKYINTKLKALSFSDGGLGWMHDFIKRLSDEVDFINFKHTEFPDVPSEAYLNDLSVSLTQFLIRLSNSIDDVIAKLPPAKISHDAKASLLKKLKTKIGMVQGLLLGTLNRSDALLGDELLYLYIYKVTRRILGSM